MFDSKIENIKHRSMKPFDRHAACTSAHGRSHLAWPSQPEREGSVPASGAAAPFQRSMGVRPREGTATLSADLPCSWKPKEAALPFFKPAQGQNPTMNNLQATQQSTRPAKRGKPLARRNLQALFDAAADEDSSRWQVNVSTPTVASLTSVETGTDHFSQDVEDTDESQFRATMFGTNPSIGGHLKTHSLFENSYWNSDPVKSLASPSPQKGNTVGPSTPAVSDSFPLASSPCPESVAEASFIPLRQFLESGRGNRLSIAEVKVMFYCIIQDLDSIHRRNIVHCSVSLDAVSLECSDDDTPLAVATLLPGRFMKPVGASRSLFGPREKSRDAYSPPETANCPVSRAVYTPHGDMWAAGCVLFAMLAGHGGSVVPFGVEGILSIMGGMKHRGLHSIDALQSWLKGHLKARMDAINAERMQENGVIVFDDLAKSLVLGLLRADPAQRLPAEKVLKHPWFTEVILKVPKRSPVYREASRFGRPSSPCARLAMEFASAAASASTSGASGARVASDDLSGLSEVVRRTETLQMNQEYAALSGFPWVDHANKNAPYPIVGYVAQPIEIPIGGRSVMMSALHTVYEVPERGAMMAATPTAVVHPTEVTTVASCLARRHSI